MREKKEDGRGTGNREEGRETRGKGKANWREGAGRRQEEE